MPSYPGGEFETEEFKRQSRDFAGLLNAPGRKVEAFETGARNHFDILFDLADPSTMLGSSLDNLIFRDSL